MTELEWGICAILFIAGLVDLTGCFYWISRWFQSTSSNEERQDYYTTEYCPFCGEKLEG
jgi:hypothetical protein